MNSKGEVQQVFIYMMVIIVVGAVILIGYTAIDGIMDKGCSVERAKFISRLQNNLDKNTAYGNTQYVRLIPPCDYEKLCFIDTENPPSTTGNSIMDLEISQGTGNNIFLVRTDTVEPILAVPKLSVHNKYYCAEKTGNGWEVTMNGTGRGYVTVGPFGFDVPIGG